jgi:hypothetical protein
MLRAVVVVGGEIADHHCLNFFLQSKCILTMYLFLINRAFYVTTWTLEKPEEVNNNGQSTDTGNIGHKTQDENKQNTKRQHNT